jgi:hypothetical protein
MPGNATCAGIGSQSYVLPRSLKGLGLVAGVLGLVAIQCGSLSCLRASPPPDSPSPQEGPEQASLPHGEEDSGQAVHPNREIMAADPWGRGAFGGRANAATLAAAGGGGAETEQAVDRGLAWIAAHQLTDGSWSFKLADCPKCAGKCSQSGERKAADRCAATAMALLPFLGHGYTHREGPYRLQVEAGIGFLVQQVILGNGQAYGSGGSLYSQGLAVIALAEYHALSEDKRLAVPTQAAIDFIQRAQDPEGGGWRYQPRKPGDISVSGWQVAALRTADEARLKTTPLTLTKAMEFLDFVQEDSGIAYGYTGPGRGAATSAVGLLCRMHLGWKTNHPSIRAGAERLAKAGPTSDLYFDFYATQVLWHVHGDVWPSWNNRMKARLLQSQSSTGHETGSWYDGVDGGHGPAVAGRLYCTSLATLILETYYRYRPLGDPGLQTQEH